jgi:LysM repeat protein
MLNAAQGCTHTIKAGDTFWQIAQDKGVDVSAIQAANPGVKAEALKVGQKINIPCSSGSDNTGESMRKSSQQAPVMETSCKSRSTYVPLCVSCWASAQKRNQLIQMAHLG